MSLLTNKNVLDVLKRSTNNKPLFNDGGKAAWIADAPVAEVKYLAVFNKSDTDRLKIIVDLDQLGFHGPCEMTNLWAGKTAGKFWGQFVPEISVHGAGLYKIRPIEHTTDKLLH